MTDPEAQPLPEPPPAPSSGIVTPSPGIAQASSYWRFWTWPYIVSMVSAVAAIASAMTAYVALITVRENFRAEQRPVIWITNAIGRPEFRQNVKQADNTGQIVWDWQFTNYGKTPALRVSFRHFMRIESKIAESYGVVAPSVGGPLPTNKVDFSTVVSRPGISQGEFNKLLETDRSLGISGDIIYFDAYGQKYETTFCLSRLSTGALTYCEEGNDIK